MIKPEMYANLHNHTVHSDGVYTVREITDIAKARIVRRFYSERRGGEREKNISF